MLPVQQTAFELPMVAIAFVGAILIFRSLRRISGRSAHARSTRTSAPGSHSPAIATAPAAIRNWEVELHELGRELQARLDNKIAILEYLIQTAAAETDRLERALAEARRQGVLDS